MSTGAPAEHAAEPSLESDGAPTPEAVDDVFRALADPHRRLLLDVLYAADGQTLGALCEHLPSMTRFGVMKHLRVLEDAGLITTRKVGREKLHYLNPVPIRLAHDRWIRKYEPYASALADLKTVLESEPDSPMPSAPSHVFVVYIQTTPERLWEAITNPAFTRRYFFHGNVQAEWRPGAPLTYTHADSGHLLVDGEVVELDPPRRLVTTWRFATNTEDRPSRVTWEIEPVGKACRLTLLHDQLEAGSQTFSDVGGGWPAVLSSLKTLLETGDTVDAQELLAGA